MKCPKCGMGVEYFVPFNDGVLITADGRAHVFKDHSLMTWVNITCSSENCDWSDGREISEEVVEGIAWEVGLLKECPEVSEEMKKVLEGLSEQN